MSLLQNKPRLRIVLADLRKLIQWLESVTEWATPRTRRRWLGVLDEIAEALEEASR